MQLILSCLRLCLENKEKIEERALEEMREPKKKMGPQ